MKIPNRYPIIYIAVFFLTLCATTINAQVMFDGGGDGTNWNDPNNWDTNNVPTATDDVILPAGSMVVINSTTNAVARDLGLNRATLTIEVGGSLIIDALGGSSTVFELDTSVVINSGMVTVINSTNDGILLDDYASAFTNNGILIVDNVRQGLTIRGGRFINNGTLNFDNGNNTVIDIKNSNILDSAFFRNSKTGTITINNENGDEAILLNSPTTSTKAEFINEGNIFIKSAGEEGIRAIGASFYNKKTGYIQILNVGLSVNSEIMHIRGTTFINDGTLEVNGGDMSEQGIYLSSGGGPPAIPGIFENNGFITIENVQREGIDVSSGAAFTNNLLINVGRSPSAVESDAVINVFDSLFNSECGVINMITEDSIHIYSNGSITNEGVMTTIYTGLHSNEGVFTNNGEIATPDGNFNIAPNALVGTGSVTMGAIPREPLPECLVVVPTMGEWAVGILALLMAIFGLVWMKSSTFILEGNHSS